VFVVGMDVTVLNVTIPTLAARFSESIQQLQLVWSTPTSSPRPA
jgi:hypothetical protein